MLRPGPIEALSLVRVVAARMTANIAKRCPKCGVRCSIKRPQFGRVRWRSGILKQHRFARLVESPFDRRAGDIPQPRLAADEGVIAVMTEEIDLRNAGWAGADPFNRRHPAIAIAAE